MSLFDGTSLAGWTGPALAHWRVEEESLVYRGEGKGQPADHWLATTRSFGNFELHFEARTEGAAGTGMFFRSEAAPERRIIGWQCDIGQGYDGGLYKEGANGGMIAYPSRERVNQVVRAGDWNAYRVRAEGPRLRTWVNGQPMADHTEPGRGWRRAGVFALEISRGSAGVVRFRNLKLEELPPDPPADSASPEGPAERITRALPPARKLAPFAQEAFQLSAHEVVVFTGSENMVLEQRHGALEARLTAHWKEQSPRFRHMSWEGDTVYRQNRMMEWGSWEDNLRATGASVVVAWFGQVEAFDDTRSVEDFTAAYGALLDRFARVTPRMVVVGPPPFEKPGDPRIPDNTPRNARVRELNDAARKLAAQRSLVFVDLIGPLSAADTGRPLTRDGLHFDGPGLDRVADVIARALGATAPVTEEVRSAIVEKNRLWFDTWRCMNWAFAYGDRVTQPFSRAGGDHPPFVDELKQYLPRLEHAEAVIHARATGASAPPSPAAPPPRADPPALSPAEQMARFKVRDGFEVTLFADESLGVVRPLQIRWDEAGRLWVACAPSYPQLQPGEHGRDYILVLEDTDGDGKADRSSRFAEGLTMPMGFTFAPQAAGAGLYVCEATQLVHLPDPDGDGKAGGRSVILSGFGTGDSHQNANSLRWGPDGCLWFTQGYHIWSHVETPRGLAELNRSGLWRFNPRTLRLDSFLNESKAGLNCWGTAWDDFGQVFHGSGADTVLWHTTPALAPTLHAAPLPTALAKSRGKSMEPEFLSSRHLPESFQGLLLKSTYFTSQVQLYRLRDQGSTFASEDLGDLISGENEFRPVETRVGPDGAIYVCDWLNPVIGHYQASYRDPRRDRSHGRIWRLTAKGRPLLPRPALAGLDATALVRHLTSPDRWERDMAREALYRLPAMQAVAAADAALTEALAERKHALLYELSGVFAAHESPRPALVDALLASDDFRWRAWGARLTGVWAGALSDPDKRWVKAVADPHPRVRLEGVVACAWAPPGQAVDAIRIATLVLDRPLDAALDYALTQCIHTLEAQWRPALADGRLDFGPRTASLTRLLTTAGGGNLVSATRDLLAGGNLPGAAREALLCVLVEHGAAEDAERALKAAPTSARVLDALVAAAERRRPIFTPALLDALLASPHEPARVAGLRSLARLGAERGQLARVDDLFARPESSAAERAAAAGALARLRGKDAWPLLRPLLNAPDPEVRTAAFAAMVQADVAASAEPGVSRLAAAASAAEAGAWLAPLIEAQNGSAALVRALEKQPLPEVAARLALQWLAENGRDVPPLREALLHGTGGGRAPPAHDEGWVRRWAAEAAAKGDARRGEQVFRSPATACLSCHRVGTEGGVLGPDLGAIGRAMTPEAIVESVFWPKRQVKEGYLLTQVTTRDGRGLQGYVAEDSTAWLVLKDMAGNPQPPIAKNEIATRQDTGTLMPEGLIDALDDDARRDLLKYLFELGR